MKNKITEDSIEKNFIDLLKNQGYNYFYGPDIAPYSENPERENFFSVILENILKNSLEKLIFLSYIFQKMSYRKCLFNQ